MKKFSFLLLSTLLLLTGCFNSDRDGEKRVNNGVKGEATTVFELKKKYGSETDKSIMPMYNVEYDEEFKFDFNSNLGDLSMYDVVSVHTDIKAEEESEIYALIGIDDFSSEKTSITVKPASATLASSSTNNGFDGWGNAPIYYIKINYDLDADKPTKLEKPMIIPFTIKSELPVPTLKHEISEDGRLKLVWNEIDGATEYNIYQIAKFNLLETSNDELRASENGYKGLYPHLVGTVSGTEFNDFMGDGKGALGTIQEGINSYQNFGVNGEYFVTAVSGDKESNFSQSVNTAALSDRLPLEIAGDLNISVHETVNTLPKKVSIKMIDGDLVDMDVIYDTSVKIEEFGGTKINFKVRGTAFEGYVVVNKISENELKALGEGNTSNETSSFVEPENKTEYVPNPNVPTIIEKDTKKEEPKDKETDKEKGNGIVENQKENTEEIVEEANKEEIITPEVVEDMKLNVDSAFEEYLALSLIQGKSSISLEAFPESQNFEVITDTLQKVFYQNPLILGVRSWSYSYDTLVLEVSYDYTVEDMQKMQKEIVKEANTIVKDIIKKGMSDEEKQKAIYDYFNDNTKYDNAALENAEANNFQKVDAKFNDSFSTYGIMVKKVGVCQSYATSYKMLSDLAGLESIVVTGVSNGVPHAWNKVKVGNEWLHVDVTNNETNSGIPYMLYNSNDATAKGINTITDDSYWIDSEINQFVGNDNSKDYYVKNGLEVDSVDKYADILVKDIKNGKEYTVLRFVGKLDQNSFMQTIGEALQKNAPDKLNTATMGSLGNYVIVKYE